jgi:hypothetical protein
MWFLIKGSIFFAAVLVALSYFGNEPVARTNTEGGLEVGDAVFAATEAYGYVTAICAEKPDVCAKGAETLSALGVRATEGARVAFELLDKQFGNAAPTNVALTQDPDPTPFPAVVDTTSTATIPYQPAEPVAAGAIPLPLKRPAH